LKYSFNIEYKLNKLEDSSQTFIKILKCSKYVTFNEISAAVTDILDMLIKDGEKLDAVYIENIMNESLKFFRQNNNKDLLFKCYTIQID